MKEENRALRDELARYHKRDELAGQGRAQVVRIGWRVLIPILDRQKVVRSFARLTNTLSGFSGPSSQWPEREDILKDARTFMEACVRYAVRRRLILVIFSLVAATIPAFQLMLFIQQNTFIEQQNEFFKIEVYDILARSMTETESNTREVSGALLANAKLEFVQGVVEEVFDPENASIVLRQEGVKQAERHFRDAGFRGSLIRAAARGVRQRGRRGMDKDELYAVARPMFSAVVGDAVVRMPQILRLGRQEHDEEEEGEADYYLYQMGYMLRIYARLSRAVDAEKQFFADVKPLLQELVRSRFTAQSRFASVYRAAMEEFLIDLALAPEFGAPPVNLDTSGKTPEQALRAGLDRLRAGVGKNALDWKQLAKQVEEK